MLNALRTAPDAATAGALEARIKQSWLDAGTPAVTLLMSRALREAGAGTDQEALDDLDAVLDLDPSQPEAWHRKAIVHYHMGDVPAAIRDIEEAVQIEPRQFEAFQTLSRIAEAREDWKGAFAAWQKAIDLDPNMPGGKEHLEELRHRAFGQET